MKKINKILNKSLLHYFLFNKEPGTYRFLNIRSFSTSFNHPKTHISKVLNQELKSDYLIA
jgi:hypothetical protein